MPRDPWDQRVARVLVRPLVRTPLTPNQLTVGTLLLALVGALLLATGDPGLANWGAGVFVLARFLDHFDGELARQKGSSSRLGYYLDYVAGAGSYAALFLGIGVGLADGWLGGWAYALGAAGAAAAVATMFVNLGIDKLRMQADRHAGRDAVGYPGFAGFELEDAMYLLAPITWLGLLAPFFVPAGLGAVVYCACSLVVLLRLRRQPTFHR